MMTIRDYIVDLSKTIINEELSNADELVDEAAMKIQTLILKQMPAIKKQLEMVARDTIKETQTKFDDEGVLDVEYEVIVDEGVEEVDDLFDRMVGN